MSARAYILIEGAAGTSPGILKKLSSIDGVNTAHAVTGQYDLIALVEGEDVMVVSAGGKVFRVPVDDIPEQHRRSRGKRLVSLPVGDRVVEVTRASGKGGEMPAPDRGGNGIPGSGSEAVDQMELLS